MPWSTQGSRRRCIAWPKRHGTAACLESNLLLTPILLIPSKKPSTRSELNFQQKTINPRPSKDAIRPESTDGQQNELNDSQNTEQETKLVKNRNKITTEHIKLEAELQCLAKKPQNCRLPGVQYADSSHFVNSVNSVQKPSNPLNSISHKNN